MSLQELTTNKEDLRRHTPRRDIQGLRAVAVLAVVAFHAGLPLPGGFTGVDVFFVISGYVITGMLLREWQRDRTIHLRNFYERRIRRLVPALLMVVLVVLILSFFLGSPFDNQQRTTALTAIGAMTMTANAVIFLQSGGYFAVPPTTNPLLNTWSLSVEEQFYLVFPLLLLVLLVVQARRSKTPASVRLVAVGIAVVTLASFLLSLLMGFGHISLRLTDPDWFAFYASPTRAWEFGVGAIAYLLTSSIVTLLKRPALAFTYWMGVLGIAASFLLINEGMIFPGWVALLPVLATAAVLITGDQALAGRGLLSNRVMVSLGDTSYSWYLWHWPLISFAILLFPEDELAPAGAALLGLALAYLTLVLVENPVRFAHRFTGLKVWLFCVASIGIVTLVAGLMLFGSSRAWGSTDVAKMMRQVSEVHLWQSTDCNSAIPVGSRGAECTWNPDGSGIPVVLLGDSMAGALSEGVLKAAEDANRPVLAGTMGACPFTTTELWLANGAAEECNTFVKESLDWLRQQQPTDIIISSSLGYTVLDFSSFRDPVTGDLAQTRDEKERLYLAGVRDAVESLTDAGHQVTVVLPPPGFPLTIMDANAWYPSQCATISAIRDIRACGATRTELEVQEESRDIFERIEQAVTEAGGRILDPRPSICQQGVCATNLGNDWLYVDGSHISVQMSARLAPSLTEFIRATP